MYGWRPVVAANTAAAVRGSVDCCTGLGVPGQPWTAAAAAAAARAPLTACGDCVPPEPEKFNVFDCTGFFREQVPVVEVTTPEVSPLKVVGRPAMGDRYEPSEASEAGLVVAAAKAACCCCCCCCINCCKVEWGQLKLIGGHFET